MDIYKDVEEALKNVAAYGGKLAAVFHQYALIAERIPSGFEGATNILDATVATLNQILTLFKDEAEGIKSGTGRELFSPEGILYVKRLVNECAKSLTKIEPVIIDGCLPRKEFKAKAKRDKKELAKKGVPEVNCSELKLDEKAFLENVENTRWSLATDAIEDCMDRLYDLQLHLLLVFQVVTVGSLSKDLSSGKVDIKSIVTYYDRVSRTANLVGLKVPKSKNRRRSVSSSSSGTASSDSDSDISSPAPRKSRAKDIVFITAPPPPPLPAPIGGPSLPGPPPPPVVKEPRSLVENSNPPSYSESHNSTTNSPTPTTASTALGTVTSSAPSSPPVADEKSNVFVDEKISTKEEPPKELPLTKPATLEPRLFKSKSHGFGFKLRTLFKSKESLAAEMKKALSDTDSHLLAFVIHRHDLRQIPHSAFHSLEATHMRTILTQLNDNTWYQTFTTLNTIEHGTLHRLMYPHVGGKVHERDVVVLKVLKEESKINAWLALLKELRSKGTMLPPYTGNRILLAIVREKLIDGKPAVPSHQRLGMPMPPGPPPPPPGPQATIVPAIRPPFLLSNRPTGIRVSDLTVPRFHTPIIPGPPPGPPPPPRFGGTPGPPPIGVRPNGPPGPPRMYPPGTALPGQKSNSIRISDTTPLTDYEATVALTTYNEYTMRLSEPMEPHLPRSWTRVAITQESAERHFVQERVERFQREGGNVIEAKLRLTEDQAGQVTRLMDEVQSGERDIRFEWCWVELSLFNQAGEIVNFIPRGPNMVASTATTMHLIAKRTPKIHLKPMEVYNSLMRGPGPIGRPPGPPPLPQAPRLAPMHPIRKLAKNRSRSVSSSSDTDSSSYSSSDSSVGHVRRRLRRYKSRKSKGKGRRCYNDSDSDSDSDSEELDSIKVTLELKRGDDIVKKLLEMWTPQEQVKGKGIEKVVE